MKSGNSRVPPPNRRSPTIMAGLSGAFPVPKSGVTAMPAPHFALSVNRRIFLERLGAAAAIGAVGWPGYAPASEPTGLISGIERSTIFPGRKAAEPGAWFHPRACVIPTADGPLAVMTMQKITGSDYFHAVSVTTSADLGKTWSTPAAIPGLGRQPTADGQEMGVCDGVPEYHARTNSTLVIGHNVYYKDGRLAKPQGPRWPVYTVRDAAGSWSPPQKLFWDDPRGSAIYTCACAQRVTLDDGNILIPFCFASQGRVDRTVTSFLCAFDENGLTIRRVGDVLENHQGRGLLEPSLARFQGRYFMTIRAEDDRGYLSTSEDGLHWAAKKAWTWDNGKPLPMSSTQQRWLVHRDGLFLVYTRRAENNVNVVRWRSPLFAAQVDAERLSLIRDTEQVVFPLVGDGVNDAKHVAHLGNFHANPVSPDESWVTVGECLPEDEYRGDALLARVKWRRPNA